MLINKKINCIEMTIKDRIFQITNQFLSMEKQEMPNIQSDTKYADIGGQYKKETPL